MSDILRKDKKDLRISCGALPVLALLCRAKAFADCVPTLRYPRLQAEG
jgi:hypothetical protein